MPRSCQALIENENALAQTLEMSRQSQSITANGAMVTAQNGLLTWRQVASTHCSSVDYEPHLLKRDIVGITV